MPVVWNGVCFLSPKWAILIRHFVKNSHITDALIFCPCQNETLELVQISVGTLFCHLFFFLYKFVPDITYYNVTHPRRVCCWDGENCRSEKCRFRLNPTFSFLSLPLVYKSATSPLRTESEGTGICGGTTHLDPHTSSGRPILSR